MKPISKLFDETLCDVIFLKEEEEAMELEALTALYNSCGITLQPLTMHSPTSLHEKRIQMLFLDKDNADANDKGILT